MVIGTSERRQSRNRRGNIEIGEQVPILKDCGEKQRNARRLNQWKDDSSWEILR